MGKSGCLGITSNGARCAEITPADVRQTKGQTMTMRITVTNMDASRTATVETFEIPQTQDFKPSGEPHVSTGTKDVAPGETADFWIYQSRYVVVKEKP